MPIYEYACKNGHLLEVFQKLSDKPPKTCPTCGQKLERVLSRTSFQLKGGGWYKDLYSSVKPESGETKPAETAGGDSTAEAKPAEAKSAEAKPTDSAAAVTESKPKPAASGGAKSNAAKSKSASKATSKGKASAKK